ncbi:MerR family transcriptional regulator [Knoellia sp. CPCC 206435]|uniref:MerR family transcriptional regulator n=1 Tax=Knoellia terrae TaxID=3404797 RepID=UPI003B436338
MGGEERPDRGRQLGGVNGGRDAVGHAVSVAPPPGAGSRTGPSSGGLTHLSVRTLRRYHEAGLLVPADIDDDTGYRYYAADQIPTAQVIHRLRDLDVPLAVVRRILATPEPGTPSRIVADHLHHLEAELDRTRAAVRSLRRLLAPEPAGARGGAVPGVADGRRGRGRRGPRRRPRLACRCHGGARHDPH